MVLGMRNMVQRSWRILGSGEGGETTWAAMAVLDAKGVQCRVLSRGSPAAISNVCGSACLFSCTHHVFQSPAVKCALQWPSQCEI